MGRYEPDNEALLKMSRFFQVPIDYILGGDFTRWDIDGSRVSSTNVRMTQITGPGISVSEPKAAYCVNGRNENCIDAAATDSKIGTTVGLSIPDTSQSANSFNTTYAQTAFDRVEFDDLTQAEVDLLAEYSLFIKSRRKK